MMQRSVLGLALLLLCSAAGVLSAFALLAPDAWLDRTEHPLLRRWVAAVATMS